MLTIGHCATLACLLEVAAPKPGNVHRGADFSDLGLTDFLASATAIGPVFDQASAQSVGATLLAAARATRQACQTNTNLGTLLLLAPLAKVPRDSPLNIQAVRAVLAALTPRDAIDTYAAIQTAHPGGMGTVEHADVHGPAPTCLLDAMRLAADRDLIARQYAFDFRDLFGVAVPWLVEAMEHAEQLAPAQKQDRPQPLTTAIVWTHVRLMAEFPDSLIARKAGSAVAAESAARAAQTLAAGPPGSVEYENALSDLDFWLRAAGTTRNPGTTADMIAAALFVLLREGIIQPPYR